MQPACQGAQPAPPPPPPPPPLQAVEHLLKEVLPIIKNLLTPEEVEEFRVHIVGSNQVPESIRPIVEQKNSGVLFHGWLSDELLYMLYNRAKLVVAPLLSGAGVKGKVRARSGGLLLLLLGGWDGMGRALAGVASSLRSPSHPPLLQVNQAMKLGVPVVATKIATEGMHIVDGVNCLVANNPREFAEKVGRQAALKRQQLLQLSRIAWARCPASPSPSPSRHLTRRRAAAPPAGARRVQRLRAVAEAVGGRVREHPRVVQRGPRAPGDPARLLHGGRGAAPGERALQVLMGELGDLGAWQAPSGQEEQSATSAPAASWLANKSCTATGERCSAALPC
jgi:hypothetical protein